VSIYENIYLVAGDTIIASNS